ncbi:MAG: AraC family transcriptional regulator [Capsulimonadaceae bacterium]|nr:AraC family transcriptional regulator [Capsulimonadaceae bacterium]
MKRLYIDEFTEGRPFHAAEINGPRAPGGEFHDHDFYEVMYVHQGRVRHVLPDRADILQTGDLVLVRPQDAHSVRSKPGEPALIFNVAFPAISWRDYCRLIRIDADRPWPSSGVGPRRSAISPQAMPACADAFERVLEAYRGEPSHLHLCVFWCSLLTCIGGYESEDRTAASNAPEWLKQACREMSAPSNLQGGITRLVELAGVSGAHLSRCMRAAMGVTPTDYINEQRLRRSAALLVSSPADITEIALDCGYDNLSYFYRLFRARYGMTPRAYRMKNSRSIVP